MLRSRTDENSFPLTFKSLKGCIKTPRGSLDFCSKEFDSGIFVTVQRKILKRFRASIKYFSRAHNIAMFSD